MKGDDELSAAWGEDRGSNEYLSLECGVRRDMVRDMVHHGLRAVSAAEALIRVKALREIGRYPMENEAAAMLSDLEYLAEREKAQQPVETPKRPAKRHQDSTQQTSFGF
jgi:hypothetical protein